MKIVHALLLVAATAACGQDIDADALRKGEVDVDRMRAGVDVVLDGSVAVLTVPFSTPAPDVPEDEFQDEMQESVALRVVCPRTGADLMTSEGVWTLNDERDAATFRFEHDDIGELVLVSGQPYAATFSIATNDYVTRVGAISFDLGVE